MNYLRGIGINIVLSIVFTLLMTICTFLFLVFFTNINLNSAEQILVENIIKIFVALIIYLCIRKLFFQESDRIKLTLPTDSVALVIVCIEVCVLLSIYFLQKNINSFSQYLLIVLAMLLTGLSEELIYRFLAIKFYPQGILTVFLQALIFAFVGHGIVTDFFNNLVYRFPIGIILGSLYAKTNSVGKVAYFHGLYDLLVYCNLF